MNKKVLITGCAGFLGAHVVKYYNDLGCITYGINRGEISQKHCDKIGLDYYIKGNVSIEALRGFNVKFDIIIHCGGSGSVKFSLDEPYEDFNKTVNGTIELLEYIRLYNVGAKIIYPSSPAVQGELNSEFILESDGGQPISPYGYHKKIAEELCESYSKQYGLNIYIVRLFSVYGPELYKQLLWDSCVKLSCTINNDIKFFGTGEETRDFVHVSDAVALFDKLTLSRERFSIINCGFGNAVSISEVISMINESLKTGRVVVFDQKNNIGNPSHYQADISKGKKLGWEPKVNFKDGINEYCNWYKRECND